MSASYGPPQPSDGADIPSVAPGYPSIAEPPQFAGIASLRRGDTPTFFAGVRDCAIREAANGSTRFTVDLIDRTGSIAGVCWNDAEALAKAIAVNTVVKVQGRVGEYGGKPQLEITRIRLARPDEYDLADIVPAMMRARYAALDAAKPNGRSVDA